ncbi:MAG: chromosome segregation protein SMC, partial [Lachnospiraceae bacterium]
MYLKSIEVHGFKSFANKIRFEFHEGITAIVGPNGSGKSNVADAVRWVLGEQRIKQLRGASMQDVIFSGTETRPAMGYASVSITLDNSDHSLQTEYDEVTVTRKLFRSGESEYLLNGNVCRLKDVNELFYDTGIGKEGYSIIGQGQIDRILSGKPEERRELFDEAAGIVKFKKRKDTTLKKLENAEQNRIRVNDILSELERTIGPLEKQSEKAREFLKYREELKKLDVNFFLLESERKEDVKKQTDEKLEIANRDLNNEKENFEKVRAEYDEIVKNLADIDTEIEETRNSLSSTGSARLKLQGEINVFQEQIHSSETAIEHFRKRIETLNTEITDREKEIEETGKGKENADADTDAIKQERDKEKAALDLIQAAIEELNQKIEHNKSEIINILNERTETRSKKERYDTMLENTRVRKAELASRLISAKSNEEEQNSIIASLQDEFDRINKELEELNFNQKKAEERLDEIHDELSAKDKELRDTQVIYHEDKSRLDAISNITERYEGYGGSVKAVMDKKEKDGISGIIGVVADIIKTEKKYEIAIETALGGNIQNIVTEDEETAKKMITYLKEIKGGRATFLPLTSIKDPEKFKNPDSLNEVGAIGLADSIVVTEEKYSDVAKSMLGRILVVDNMDNALAIARKYRYGIRMVTLDGELL